MTHNNPRYVKSELTDTRVNPPHRNPRICWMFGHDFTPLAPGLAVPHTCARCGDDNPWIGWKRW